MFPAYKIIGAWISVDSRVDSGPSPVRRYERLWSSDWNFEGWIKPQIDYAIGDLGCNTIHCIGGAWGVSQGRVDAGLYRDRLVQVAEYIKSKGAYFALRLDSIRGDTDATTSAAAMARIHAAYLAPLEAVGNLLAIDPIGEFEVGEGYFGPLNGSYGAYIRGVTNGIKNSGIKTPISWSVKYDTPADNSFSYNAAMSIIDAQDFIETHIYTFPSLRTSLDDYLLNTDKQIFIGETGKNNMPTTAEGGGTETEQVSDLSTVYGLALSGHPRIIGVSQWLISDLYNSVTTPVGTPVTQNEWGIYDTNTTPGAWVARRHKAEQIRRYTRGSCVLSKTI